MIGVWAIQIWTLPGNMRMTMKEQSMTHWSSFLSIGRQLNGLPSTYIQITKHLHTDYQTHTAQSAFSGGRAPTTCPCWGHVPIDLGSTSCHQSNPVMEAANLDWLHTSPDKQRAPMLAWLKMTSVEMFLHDKLWDGIIGQF